MAMNETQSGMLSGAAAGFQVAGPIGGIIGGAIGMFAGKSASRRRAREERRILVANTKQSYGIGEQYVAQAAQNREQVGSNYARDMGQARARFAAGGAKAEGASWDSVVANIGQKRSESLETLDIERETYEKSSAYDFIKQDYQSMKGKTGQGWGQQGTSGGSFYTDSQRDMLKNIDSGGRTRHRGITTAADPKQQAVYNKYWDAITPTFEEYETSRFGSAEDKSAFEETMTDRIKDAGATYELDLEIDRFTTRQNNQLSGRDRDRGRR